MTLNPTTDEMVDAVAVFGRDLMMLENPALGARAIPFATLLAEVNSWIASQESTVRGILCTQTGQVKPEIISGVNMAGLVSTAIRAHYGDKFPAGSCAACLVSYGLTKFCAAPLHNDPAG
jgi:hypothetical protein